MSENLRTYTKALYALDSVVRRVDDDDWDNQSPNEDWSAKETLGHVIWGVRRMANALRDQGPPAEQAEADVAGQQPAKTWSEALDDVMEALDQRGVLSKSVTTPFGEMTIDDAIGIFYSDALTHAWDIAKAAGIEPAIPEDLARKSVVMLSAAGDAIRGPGMMRDAIEVSETASDADKFIAMTGRKPSQPEGSALR